MKQKIIKGYSAAAELRTAGRCLNANTASSALPWLRKTTALTAVVVFWQDTVPMDLYKYLNPWQVSQRPSTSFRGSWWAAGRCGEPLPLSLALLPSLLTSAGDGLGLEFILTFRILYSFPNPLLIAPSSFFPLRTVLAHNLGVTLLTTTHSLFQVLLSLLWFCAVLYSCTYLNLIMLLLLRTHVSKNMENLNVKVK